MTALLYILMIFVWGLSWIAIKSQQGEVAMEVSIFYRFAIAAIFMFVFGALFKKIQRVNRRDHYFFMLQGLCLFCFNFIAFYNSTAYIASGLTAVAMATAPIFNAIAGRVIYKTPTSEMFWVGVGVGLTGICLLFFGDLATTQWSADLLIGLTLALIGTCFFSMGNMISIRNTKQNIKPYTGTSYAMVYGCVMLAIIAIVRGLSFNVSVEPQYLAGLFYLAVPASVIGFTAYLMLVDKIGANSAAYLLVITPIVALIVSSFYEGYHWNYFSTLGLICVISGSVLTQIKKVTLKRYITKLTPALKLRGSPNNTSR